MKAESASANQVSNQIIVAERQSIFKTMVNLTWKVINYSKAIKDPKNITFQRAVKRAPFWRQKKINIIYTPPLSKHGFH